MNGDMTRRLRLPDGLLMSFLLAFSGGFQDAYTFVVRDRVFANAQTGNVVLMATRLMEGEWGTALRYLFPLLAFAAGVGAAEWIRHLWKGPRWQRGILLLEMAILFGVGWMPRGWNVAANCLVSFSCAMQVQAFRTVMGHPYASTMCIGNLRSGTEAFTVFLRERDRSHLSKAACYFAVILVFAVGAGTGGVLSGLLQERTVWSCCGVLALAALLMAAEKDKR